MVRVLSGLKPGQQIVTQGALFLQREQATPLTDKKSRCLSPMERARQI